MIGRCHDERRIQFLYRSYRHALTSEQYYKYNKRIFDLIVDGQRDYKTKYNSQYIYQQGFRPCNTTAEV